MMNIDQITPTEITIKDKKKSLKGQVNGVAISSYFKIIEVKSDLNESYYFIFYKNTLIYGDQLEKVEKGSFIDRAYRDGIVFESLHPFLPALIPSEIVSMPNKNKLFSQLQNQYPLQEIAYISTALDSFFTKKQLINLIDDIYFHYRRNGNYLKAYQIIRILTDFAPKYSSASDRLNSHDFLSYSSFYQSSSLPAIYKKDPLYAEFSCFKNRNRPNEHKFLGNLFTKQDRSLELLLLWMEKPQIDMIEMYTKLALQFVSMDKWMLTLSHLNINPFRSLSSTKSVIDKMMRAGAYEAVAGILLKYMDDLPKEYDDTLNQLWEGLDTSFVATHLDALISVIHKLVQMDDHKQTEQRLIQLVGKLLEQHDIKTVYEKLLPIQEVLPHSTVMRKIKKMIGLLEDPDQMMELGQYYAEFKQYDEAIECFSWEMELRPEDSTPVWQLSKMYQHKGMVNEATAYQQIFTQMKRNQGIS